jgi:glycogen debranching enzyme
MSKKGHYFSIPIKPDESISNFNGWFNILGNEYMMYKSIDNIYLDDESVMTPKEFINNFSDVERIYDIAKEKFMIVKNGLIYDVSAHKNIHINIDLDFRRIFDYDDKGRIYTLYKENIHYKEGKNFVDNDLIIIEYKKYSDDSLTVLKEKFFLCIFGIGNTYEVVDRWMKKAYEYDKSRGSKNEFYIYKALKTLCKSYSRLIFTFAPDKDEAREKLLDILHNQKTINDVYHNYVDDYLSQKFQLSETTGTEIAMGYANALHALDGMNVSFNMSHKKTFGIWAGLPWFFQFWARDELISLRSLMLVDKKEFAKIILSRHINDILPDGRIPNIYPSAGLGSADGVGWLFKRIYDFIVLLDESGDFSNHINLFELKYFRERLQFSIKQLLANYYIDGLIKNAPLETWMDTYSEDDNREGFRIEIQALFLSMLRLMNMLNNMLANKFVKKNNKLVNVTTNEFDYRKLERDFARTVRERFLRKLTINDEAGTKEVLMLNDGYNCSNAEVIRPNIFLTYYLYSDLLHNEEWESVFDYAIEKLWLKWDLGRKDGGGLSTIDKTHRLYNAFYTGQNNKSYHRGDSWFFINNIAAIALYRLNKDKYFSYVKNILNGSTEDILYSGFIGYASEVSSGAVFKPGGCFCQAWSIATYIELIHEMFL